MKWPTQKDLRDALNGALRQFVVVLLALIAGFQTGVVPGVQPAALYASCLNNPE